MKRLGILLPLLLACDPVPPPPSAPVATPQAPAEGEEIAASTPVETSAPTEEAPAPEKAPTAVRVLSPGAPPAIEAEGVPEIPKELKERLFQYENVRSASFQDFGPNGSLVVLTRLADTAQLHLVPSPGGRREQISFQQEPVSYALVPPGGEDIFFVQSTGGNEKNQIFRLDRKSGKAILLTDGMSRHHAFTFSRDGQKLAIASSKRNGKDLDLYLMPLQAPDSWELLMEGEGDSWSVQDFSPDGRYLLLLQYVSANESYPYILDLATKEKTAIPIPEGEKASHGALKFSADGKGVYLSSSAAGEFRTLAYVDLATMKYDWISQHIPWDVTNIAVSKNEVAFVVNEDGSSRLYLLDKKKTKLPQNRTKPVDLPMGIVSGLKFSQDGKRLGLTLSRPDAPSDAYVYEVASKKLSRWTYSEMGGLDPEGFVVPERISYKSFDEREIPAYVFRPKTGGKAPVVIFIHGGPEAQYRPYFSGMFQFWVNELGLAVIAPNVRGSSGYGKTYLSLDDVEKREDSVKDIGALLDWISTQPDLDASRVAVYGGSYGGYMVLASLVMFGERIRAGVDIVGIANFTTFLEKTSPYRVDLRRVEYGDERKPEIRDLFAKISPANSADKIRSALMVAHGKNDPRVPFFEAEQIVAKVKEQGRSVWTVYADNEGHGFQRKENRDYLTAAVVLFFQEHLLGQETGSRE